MEDENTLKGKATVFEAMSNAQKNAADLFPEDPAAAQKFYQKEMKRIGGMFPGILPDVDTADDGKPVPVGTNPVAAGATPTPVSVSDRYRQSMASRNTGLMDRFAPPNRVFAPPAAGPTGDFFPAGRTRPAAVPRPPLSPDLELFPGGPPTAGVTMATSPAIRKPMPIPGRVVQPVPTAAATGRSSIVRRVMPAPGAMSSPTEEDFYSRRGFMPYGR
jgi:hypothetical protein